jgi:DnaK suppressor protein
MCSDLRGRIRLKEEEMDAKLLKKFEGLLLAKRKQLLESIGYYEDSLMNSSLKDSMGNLSSYSDHMADLGTDAEEREKAYHFVSKEGRLLYHIDEALRRIQSDNYGKCVECGEEISLDRLEAVPHARLCIRCKQKEEEKRR